MKSVIYIYKLITDVIVETVNLWVSQIMQINKGLFDKTACENNWKYIKIKCGIKYGKYNEKIFIHIVSQVIHKTNSHFCG